MLSFDNWRATEQGGFFQHKFDSKHQLTESELRKIYETVFASMAGGLKG